METRYLNTLIASVEAGTFSKTAELLHITQSAVSQRIKFLEEHFGQQLLDRSGQLVGLQVDGFEHRRGPSVVMLPQRSEDALLKEFLESLFEVVSPLWRPQLLKS